MERSQPRNNAINVSVYRNKIKPEVWMLSILFVNNFQCVHAFSVYNVAVLTKVSNFFQIFSVIEALSVYNNDIEYTENI